MGEKFRSLLFVVLCATVAAQSGPDGDSVGSSKPASMLPLVGVTMCSMNHLPFDWASDYEVAVVYITSMWPELAADHGEPSLQGIIAENGFLNYCARFKNKLAAWAKSLRRDGPDVGDAAKKTVTDWYRAVDNLSRNDWTLPDHTPSVEWFGKQFRTAYKHLVVNGADVWERANGERVKRDVDAFVRGIADALIGTLKDISEQIRNVPPVDLDATATL